MFEEYEVYRSEVEENTHRVRLSKYVELIECNYCKRILPDNKFIWHGGADGINFGVCRDCKHLVPPFPLLDGFHSCNDTFIPF